MYNNQHLTVTREKLLRFFSGTSAEEGRNYTPENFSKNSLTETRIRFGGTKTFLNVAFTGGAPHNLDQVRPKYPRLN